MQKKTVQSPLTTDKQALLNKKEMNNYKSQMLFAGKQEIVIEHDGQAYKLRITRQNKLILTK